MSRPATPEVTNSLRENPQERRVEISMLYATLLYHYQLHPPFQPAPVRYLGQSKVNPGRDRPTFQIAQGPSSICTLR